LSLEMCCISLQAGATPSAIDSDLFPTLEREGLSS